MKLYIRNIILFAVALCPIELLAQDTSTMHQKLATDTTYMALIKQEALLSAKQDSVQNTIEKKRAAVALDPTNTDSYTAQIMELEASLFDIRNLLGIVATKTNAIEQEYIITQMNTTVESALASQEATGAAMQQRNLIDNTFFAQNLNPDERAIISLASSVDKKVTALSIKLSSAINNQKAALEAYNANTEKSAADSLIQLFKNATYRIAQVDDSLKSIWQPILTTKTYTYERLLDKINTPSSLLENINEQSRELRSQVSEAASAYAAPTFAMYGRELKMVIQYEKLLAERLNLKLSLDSLKNAEKRIILTAYDFARIGLTEHVLVDYAPLTISTSGAHTEANPPKELIIPSKGPLYKLEILTVAKPLTTYTSLRKIHPVEYREVAGGKIVYYAGTYRTLDAAKADQARLQKLAMKPTIIAWKDGNRVDLEGNIIVEQPAGDFFRVEIPESSITTEKINSVAPAKEISIIDKAGVRIYSVGIFQTYPEALEISKTIGTEAKVIGIKVE